ncbi:rRNA 2'-O-methyltransferase fibrillarin-like, partial [Pecten maximus]|uniref:rRNA 2'-O-methyltransferase fibrillarin-like n=1 Tax=Pecten maximus TaxID=6579 RepID=UPI001458891D
GVSRGPPGARVFWGPGGGGGGGAGRGGPARGPGGAPGGVRAGAGGRGGGGRGGGLGGGGERGLSETIQSMYRGHGIAAALETHKTLRNGLVHPKAKTPEENIAVCIYKLGCKNCEATYIGETGRRFEYDLMNTKKAWNPMKEKTAKKT